MLLEAGLITEEQLGEALKYQAQEKERLGTTLVKHNYITEKQLIDTLRIQLGIEYIDLSKVDITPEMSRYVPKPGENDECGSGPCFQGSALSGDGGSIELHGDRGGKAHLKKEDRADDRVGTGGETCHQCFIRK